MRGPVRRSSSKKLELRAKKFDLACTTLISPYRVDKQCSTFGMLDFCARLLEYAKNLFSIVCAGVVWPYIGRLPYVLCCQEHADMQGRARKGQSALPYYKPQTPGDAFEAMTFFHCAFCAAGS
jgi:hypothetical protein